MFIFEYFLLAHFTLCCCCNLCIVCDICIHHVLNIHLEYFNLTRFQDLKISTVENLYCLRGISSNPMVAGAKLCVLCAVYFNHIDRGRFHAVVFICQLIPGPLQPLTMTTPVQDKVQVVALLEQWNDH